ncbi:MAG TPA: D-alanine--D-alanine ligase [Candidatus Saccharimonadia bacterium]|nr:D-alanine--D-alanine ligase [Candidatus Saccharimonadia bacterium]
MNTTSNETQQERVLVLQGGLGSERAVSLRSAAHVVAALRETGYAVATADPVDPKFTIQKAAQNADLVISMVHGQGGEDGTSQQILEAMGKPFLGSGSSACALTFNKALYRDFMAVHGIRMAAGEVVSGQAFTTSKLRQAPYVLKPVDGGSSIDMVLVRDLADEPSSVYFDELFTHHQQMLLEQLIVGQEITVGVLGDIALPVILIVPPAEAEFDYENKYNGATQEIVNPPQLSLQVQEHAKQLALRIHRLTGCRHLSRTDMIVTPEGELYVLETNTLPGMTAESLFPKAAAAAGYDMQALVRCFVAMAKEV